MIEVHCNQSIAAHSFSDNKISLFIYAVACWYWMAFHLVGNVTLAYDTAAVPCCCDSCWGWGFIITPGGVWESFSDTARRDCRSNMGMTALVITCRRDMMIYVWIILASSAWLVLYVVAVCNRVGFVRKKNCDVSSSECFFVAAWLCGSRRCGS